MRKILLAAAALSLSPAAHAAEIYHVSGVKAQAFKMAGVAMRASFMCPSDNAKFRDSSFALMEAGGGRAYVSTHQAQTERWMVGGGREFDSFTRERGLEANCAILSKAVRTRG
jgi:hypothetical protein